MSAATECVGCGHDADAHPRVWTKDHGDPVTWSTQCVQCDAAGDYYCPEYVGPIVESVEVESVVPLEERLRTALVASGLAGGALTLVLLSGAFGLAVAARWVDDPRPLDGTAVLSVVAAVVVGVLSAVAVRYGIAGAAGADDVPVLPGDDRAGESAPPRPPAGESGVSRGRDGAR